MIVPATLHLMNGDSKIFLVKDLKLFFILKVPEEVDCGGLELVAIAVEEVAELEKGMKGQQADPNYRTNPQMDHCRRQMGLLTNLALNL